MQLEMFPTSLTLAIASLGALLSDDQDTQQFGLSLHNCVRDFIFSVPNPLLRKLTRSQ
jgi:hypothetical protein